MSTAPDPTYTHAISRPDRLLVVALALFCFRWLAGILENLGLAMASEAAAMAMLSGLGISFLFQMRLAEKSAIFVAGLLAWIGAAGFSLLANPATDARTSSFLLALLILYALFANATISSVRTRTDLNRIWSVLALFVIVGAGLSAWQISTGGGFVEGGKQTTQRAFGSDVHPVSFAIQLVAALTALEVIRVKLRQPFNRTTIFLFIVGAGALYLTFARTAWVMAFFVVGFALLNNGPMLRRVLFGLISLLVGIGIISTSSRFADLASLPFFLSNFSIQDAVFDWRYVDNSISWRIVNWTYGFQQALEAPILGFGPGQSAQNSQFNLEMHNIFLETFYEGGIFGLSAFLLCLAGLFRMHRSLPSRTSGDRYARALTNGFGIALLLAVSFSTSFVDQLMSFLIYLMLLAAAQVPSETI